MSGSYTTRVRVCTDPLYYDTLQFKHRTAIQALSKANVYGIEITDSGYPIVNNISSGDQSAVSSYVDEIFKLNQASRILLESNREKLNEEVVLLSFPQQDDRLKSTKKLPDVVSVQHSQRDNDDSLANLGINFDMSQEAQAGRAYLARKRRMHHEIWTVTPFIPALGLAGILMASPPYSTVVLGNTAYLDRDDDVRYSAVNIMMGDIATTSGKYQMYSGDLLMDDNDRIQLRNDLIESLNLTASVLERKNFGVNDRSSSVKDLAGRALVLIDEERRKLTSSLPL